MSKHEKEPIYVRGCVNLTSALTAELQLCLHNGHILRTLENGLTLATLKNQVRGRGLMIMMNPYFMIIQAAKN